MVWHWMLFAIILFLTILETNGNIKGKRSLRIAGILTLVFIFISSIRWNQNIADWTGYNNIFSYQKINGFIGIFKVDYWAFEPLFYLPFRAIKYFTDDYLWVDIYLAVVSIGVFYFAAKYLTTYRSINSKEYGTKKPLIIASYFVFYSTTLGNIYAVRTSMATAVCFYSIRFIEKKNLKKFLLTILVATLLHFSAAVFVLAYFIYHLKLNYKVVVRIAVIALVVKIVGISRLISLIGLLGGRYAEKALRYNITNASSDLSYLNDSTTTLIIKAILNAFAVSIIILLIRKHDRNNIRINGLTNIYISGVLMQILTIGYNFEFSRIALYGLSTQYFLIPYVLRIKTKRNMKLIIFFVFVIYMGVKFYSLIGRQDGYAVFPTIFSR